VTASGCGPIAENTATYMAKSASSIMVGPEMVPPGRRLLPRGRPGARDIAVADPLDRQAAAWIKGLRKFGGEQLADLLGGHDWRRHASPKGRHIPPAHLS